MNTQFTFSFDPSRCSGCFACVIACQDQNDSDIAFRTVVPCEQGQQELASISFLSLACFHCGDAPCIMVCPTGALFRDEDNGIVNLNRDVCVGCHSCALACPFGAPHFGTDGRMVKCDLCHLRIHNEMVPACVRTCPTHALGFGTTAEIGAEKTRKAGHLLIKHMVPNA
jgi:Fe-S-cluster-containing dehydrogenase component